MSDSPSPPIPVICDRCREEGSAGDDPFTDIRDLLAFEPVKRRAHVNGWKPEHQRAFIAALAMTGSPRQAAAALGRWPNGAEQLRKGKGARSFADAWDAALELYREREFFRIRDNLANLAEQQEQRDELGLVETHRRALPPPSPSPRRGEGWGEGEQEWEGEGPADETAPLDDDLVIDLLTKYSLKLLQERTARHEGKIAQADFYLRQATFFEVAIDLASVDLFEALSNAQRGGHGVLDIAETPTTRMLDEVRRKFWEMTGEPQRPPRPEHLLEQLDTDAGPVWTEPLESAGKASTAPSWVDPQEWRQLDSEEQFHRYKEQHARDAQAYVEWLERATAEWAARQNSLSRHAGEGRGEGPGQ
jgi:hypothetical protein